MCFTIEFMWTVNHSEGFEAEDPAYVAVIDNGKFNYIHYIVLIEVFFLFTLLIFVPR